MSQSYDCNDTNIDSRGLVGRWSSGPLVVACAVVVCFLFCFASSECVCLCLKATSGWGLVAWLPLLGPSLGVCMVANLLFYSMICAVL